MRCYFMRGGHIFGVEELPNLSDSKAVEKAMALFKLRGDEVDGVELWDRSRFIMRHPPAPPDR
jgi:hypothetical protein